MDYYDDDEDFDGIFVIEFEGDQGEAGTLTYPGPDGKPRSVAIPAAGAGEAISVNIGTGSVTTGPQSAIGMPFRIGVPSALRNPTLMGGVNYTALDVPKAGYGVSHIGSSGGGSGSGGERFIDRIGGRIDWVGYGGDALFPAGKFTIGLGYHGGSGSRRDSGQLADGGETRGIVFIGDSPVFGTGINLGTLGLDIEGRTDLDQHGFYGKFGMPIAKGDGKSSIMPYIKLSYTQTDIRQMVNYSLPAYLEGFSSTVEHDLENNRFSVGLGGYYNRFVSEKFAIGLNLEGTVHFNDRKLTSWQMVDLFGTTDTVNVQDDDKDTSFGALAELSGTYYVTPSLGLNLYARYRYDDDIGRIDNPLSGNDILAGETSRIGSGNTDEISVGARMILTFGLGF